MSLVLEQHACACLPAFRVCCCSVMQQLLRAMQQSGFFHTLLLHARLQHWALNGDLVPGLDPIGAFSQSDWASTYHALFNVKLN